LLTFVIRLVALLNGYQVAAVYRDDFGPGAASYPDVWFASLLGQDLGSGVFGLVWCPVWALLLGLIGGRFGAGLRTAPGRR
jgi:hypothetical protein